MSFIPQAMADTSAAAQPESGMSMLIMLGLFGVIFYFMDISPTEQTCERAPHFDEFIAKGDEILTSGGLVGKISKIPQESDYISVSLNDQTVITLKKDYISAILPKGSIQTL